ncbi:21553_t:CDS:2 [Cetraspora pellucida]|uniref:21553_t:CDS:1 n=1 Tax=Cetraspora pellucida TaxID=1433469 RepID=A0A9N9F6W0_9GLOM|nr:21553_t:CDS:2 [Cetraspora pellucida]
MSNLAYLRKHNDSQERITEDEESVSQRTPDSNEKIMDIRATPIPNRTTYESRTTTPEETGNVQCKICSKTFEQHKYWDCPNTICNKYQETGHTHQNCPNISLLKKGNYCGYDPKEVTATRINHLINLNSSTSKSKKNIVVIQIPVITILIKEGKNTGSIPDRVTNLQELELLKEEQEEDEFFYPEVPLFYNEENNNIKEEIAYNQAITESLNNLNKENTKRPETYAKWCKETTKELECTLCKECLLPTNIKEESSYVNITNMMEKAIYLYCINCYNKVYYSTQYCTKYIQNPLGSEEDLARGFCQECYTKEKGKAKEAFSKDCFFNELITTKQKQQVDQEHLINLIKYEGLKRIIQRIVGVIDKSVDSINESFKLRLSTKQQAFKEAMQRGQSQTRRLPRITITTVIEDNNNIEVEEITQEEF